MINLTKHHDIMRSFLLLLACCTAFSTFSRSLNDELDTICTIMDTPRYQEYVALSCAATLLNAAQQLTIVPKGGGEQQLLLLLLKNSSPFLFINTSFTTRKRLLKALLKFESALLSTPESRDKRQRKKETEQLVQAALKALQQELDAYTTETYGVAIENAPHYARNLQEQLKKTNPKNS